jgi:hypothetical protein
MSIYFGMDSVGVEGSQRYFDESIQESKIFLGLKSNACSIDRKFHDH